MARTSGHLPKSPGVTSMTARTRIYRMPTMSTDITGMAGGVRSGTPH